MAVKFLPGAELNSYYEEREWEQRLLYLANGLIWTVTVLAVIGLLLTVQ